MPISGWCAKLSHCIDDNLERQVVARSGGQSGRDYDVTRVPAHDGDDGNARNNNHSAPAIAPTATALAGGDDDDPELLLTSGSTLATRCSSASTSNSPVDDDDELLDSARSLSELTTSRRLSALVRRRPRVPTISATTLYNTMQTNGVVVIDCRDADDFALGHLPGALHCPYAKGRKKSVDDVIALAQNKALARKLAARDLMEVVVLGANRSSVLYKLDWGYRVARLLLSEGRVYSVRFLVQGFPLFARKYGFLLQTRPTICVGLPAPAVLPQAKGPDCTSYPNEIVEDALYLGNFWHATSARVLEALQITHVVNVGAPTTDRVALESVTYLDVAIPDRVDADMTKELAPAVAFIESARRANPHARVLIHCVQGVSRSATIAIWYVMVSTRCTLAAAYAHVLKCRPLVFPNQGFMQQLIAAETALYGSASVTLEELELLQHGLLQTSDRASSQLRHSFAP